MQIREIIDSKKVIIKDGTEQIQRGLSYVFPDTEYILSEKRTGNDEQCILTLSEEDDGINLSEYAKKANYLTDINKKIAVWGYGHIGKECLKKWGELYPHRKIQVVIDNAGYLKGTFAGEFEIVPFNKIETSIHEYFIVVCVEDYLDILQLLAGKGLKPGKDFAVWKTVFKDTGAALVRTLTDTARYDVFCKRPFGFLDIMESGMYPCCPASIDFYSIGYFDDADFDNLMSSKTARILQLSVINRTYTFCDKRYCIFHELEKRKTESIAIAAGTSMEVCEDTIRSVMFGMDDSCNLSCPSCRNGILVDKRAMHPYRVSRAAEFMEKIGRTIEDLCFSGCGEPFFSKLIRGMMSGQAWVERDEISILCNATLLNKNNFEKYLAGHGSIKIALSIDGATKATYEKLRRNGKYETVMSNLEYLGKLRNKNEIEKLLINFVVQADNVGELDKMRRIARENHVDRINVLKIYDYGLFEDGEFESSVSIIDERNKNIKQEYKAYFSEDILSDPIFNWYLMAEYVDRPKQESVFNIGFSII